MQTSRFPLGLIATLAVGLGFSLSSSDAVGYPTTGVVSFGTNPVRSYAGAISRDSSLTFIASAEQDFVVTDVSFIPQSNNVGCMDNLAISLQSDSVTVARYGVSTPYCYSSRCDLKAQTAVQTLSAGILVPAGQDLSIHSSTVSTHTYTGCSASRSVEPAYTISGYFTHP